MVKIFELLSKKSISKVIRYFLEHPTTKIHAQKLMNEMKISKKSMLDGLHEAVKAGILETEEIGRTKRYSLKRTGAIARQLKILYSIDRILPLLKGMEEVEVYLYGSAARGEDTEKSDIDLLIIGEKPSREVIGKLGREEKLKSVYFTHEEYSQLARKDKPFYERIEKDRIRLL